jgi:hypothetical protein
MIRSGIGVVAGWVLCALGAASSAYAAPVTWDIDVSQSDMTLSVPQQTLTVGAVTATVRVRNQGTTGSGGSWTLGNKASVDGTLLTDYVDGSSIQFVTNPIGNVFANNSGSYRPNPAAFNSTSTNTANPAGQYTNTTTAPAAFGARVHISALGGFVQGDAGQVSFQNVLLNVLNTSVLPITGINFNSTGVQVGIDSSLVNFDGAVVGLAGQVIPDSSQSPFLNIFAANGTTTSTVENLGGLLRKLTVNVSIPNLTLDFGGNLLTAGIAGKFVAFATIPEPSTLLLGSIGIIALGIAGRRKRLGS